MMRLVWAAALVAAVLWPSRIIGPLDGAPLDAPLEAILIGLVLPLLWTLNPGFLRGFLPKALIVFVLTWKMATALLMTQGGWCAEFLTPDPPPGSYRLDRSWDLRTYFEGAPPSCSAIVARRYDTLSSFPAWSINAPIDQFWIMGYGAATVPSETPRPPAGAYRMIVEGWLRPSQAGTLSLELGDDVEIDGASVGIGPAGQRGGRVIVPLTEGEHFVSAALNLTGDRWRFVPRWNDRDLFGAVRTSVAPATLADRIVGGWGWLVTPACLVLLLLPWMASTAARLSPSAGVTRWMTGSIAAAVLLAALNRDGVIRWAIVALAGAAFVPMPDRLRHWRGAVLLFGVPWLAIFAVRSIPQVGHFTMFSQGDDWLTFQQFAHRIFMQGYWLQGGQATFWYQPLYRWTTGVLHLAFGDSSVGDLYWDTFGLLIGALFAYEVTNRVAGFRAGVIAGTLTLATLTLGPNWYLIGRGLSEISGSAWVFLSALSLMRARSGSVPNALLAGFFSVLAFYTRLNHLPLVIALVVLLWPETVLAGTWTDWRALWRGLPKRPALIYLSCLVTGVTLFAARTWHYTGQFSVFAGTTRGYNGTGLGTTVGSMSSGAAWRSAIESVMMIVTVQDPPRFDPRSLLVVSGVCLSALGLMRVPVARRLPLGLALACLAAIAGGLVARGIAYPGRFSIHLIPLTVAASVCVAALAQGGITRG